MAHRLRAVIGDAVADKGARRGGDEGQQMVDLRLRAGSQRRGRTKDKSGENESLENPRDSGLKTQSDSPFSVVNHK